MHPVIEDKKVVLNKFIPKRKNFRLSINVDTLINKILICYHLWQK